MLERQILAEHGADQATGEHHQHAEQQGIFAQTGQGRMTQPGECEDREDDGADQTVLREQFEKEIVRNGTADLATGEIDGETVHPAAEDRILEPLRHGRLEIGEAVGGENQIGIVDLIEKLDETPEGSKLLAADQDMNAVGNENDNEKDQGKQPLRQAEITLANDRAADQKWQEAGPRKREKSATAGRDHQEIGHDQEDSADNDLFRCAEFRIDGNREGDDRTACRGVTPEKIGALNESFIEPEGAVLDVDDRPVDREHQRCDEDRHQKTYRPLPARCDHAGTADHRQHAEGHEIGDRLLRQNL